jgi:hypothetical protein
VPNTRQPDCEHQYLSIPVLAGGDSSQRLTNGDSAYLNPRAIAGRVGLVRMAREE